MNEKNNRFLTRAPGAQVWAITGGIASGKSTVSRILSEMGYFVLDADQIARSLSSEKGRAAPAILKEFQTLDRTALRTHVFNDPDKKSRLETILHPLIREESKRILEEYFLNPSSKKQGTAFYEASLIFEAGREKDFDGILNIAAPVELRKKRALERNGLSPEILENILSQQWSEEKRTQKATETIHNTGSLLDLKLLLTRFLNQLSAS